jgi:hypothetical protein
MTQHKVVIFPRASGAGWAVCNTATGSMRFYANRNAARISAARQADAAGYEIVDAYPDGDDAATLAAHAAAVAQPVRRRS